MRNLLITLRFCGASYHGFQVQKNALTITPVRAFTYPFFPLMDIHYFDKIHILVYLIFFYILLLNLQI